MDFIHMTDGHPAAIWIGIGVLLLITTGGVLLSKIDGGDAEDCMFGGLLGFIVGAFGGFVTVLGITGGTLNIAPSVNHAATAEALAVEIGDMYGVEVSVDDAAALMAGVNAESSAYEGEALVTFGEASVLVERDTLVTLELARQDGEWVLFSDGQRLTPSTTADTGWS